jgi:hypothetical protein
MSREPQPYTKRTAASGANPSRVAKAFADWCTAIRAANRSNATDSECEEAYERSLQAIDDMAGERSRDLSDVRRKLHALRYETASDDADRCDDLLQSIVADAATLGGDGEQQWAEIREAPTHPRMVPQDPERRALLDRIREVALAAGIGWMEDVMQPHGTLMVWDLPLSALRQVAKAAKAWEAANAAA